VDLLLKAGANPDIPNNNKQTPLHEAASHKQHLIVRALLAAGANPNVKDENGVTPLHMAAANTEEGATIVELCNDKRLNPNLGDALDIVPLQLAVEHLNVEGITALLAAGAGSP